MQPEQPQSSFTQYSPNPQPTAPLEPGVPPPTRSNKKIVIVIIAIVIVLAGGAGAWWFFTQKPASKSESGNNPAPSGTNRITFGQDQKVMSYAGNKVYDACNLIPQSFFEEKIEKYGDVAKRLGSDDQVDKPIMMDHGYIDRDVPNVLGKDGTPREPSMSVSEKGTDATIRAESFVNLGDSYCIYGQGKTFGTEFAKVYVMQPPVPIPAKFTNYLNEMKQKGRMVGEVQGVQAYVEEVKPGDSEYVTILKKGNVIVVITSPLREILDASDIALANLAKDPTGPLTAAYPQPYGALINPCSLLSASDFERLLGKPDSAVTGETLVLNEISKNVAQRECHRIEVERTGKSEITSTDIILMEARTEDDAKKALKDLKEKPDITITPVQNLGDEAYALTDDFAHTTVNKHITVRVGKRIVQVNTSGETKDTSIDAFKNRTLPVAQVVVNNLKK